MYEELAAARVRKDQAAVLQLSTRLVVDYANTQYVQGRLAQIQAMTVPGNDPVEPAPAVAQPAEDGAFAELKKIGFSTVEGDWQIEKGKGFSIQTGARAEADLKDGGIALSYVLDEGSQLDVYMRHDGGTPEALKERARIESYAVEMGEGYGVRASKAGIEIYGDKSIGLTNSGTSRGSMERMPIPIKLQNLAYQPGAHFVSIQVHGDDLIVTSDDRTFKYREKLRDGGNILLRITGRAKIVGLKLAK